MNGFMLLVLLAASAQLGDVPQQDYGWQINSKTGLLEYIVQISPEKAKFMIDNGKEFESEIPPEIAIRVSKVVVSIGREPIRSTPIEEVLRLPPRVKPVLADIESVAGRGRFSDLESASPGSVMNVAGANAPPPLTSANGSPLPQTNVPLASGGGSSLLEDAASALSNLPNALRQPENLLAQNSAASSFLNDARGAAAAGGLPSKFSNTGTPAAAPLPTSPNVGATTAPLPGAGGLTNSMTNSNSTFPTSPGSMASLPGAGVGNVGTLGTATTAAQPGGTQYGSNQYPGNTGYGTNNQYSTTGVGAYGQTGQTGTSGQYGAANQYGNTVGGQYSGTQVGSGQYSNGQHTNGQYPNNQYATGQNGAGQYASGQFSNGQYPTSQYPTGQYANGQYANGQYANGGSGTTNYVNAPPYNGAATTGNFGGAPRGGVGTLANQYATPQNGTAGAYTGWQGYGTNSTLATDPLSIGGGSPYLRTADSRNTTALPSTAGTSATGVTNSGFATSYNNTTGRYADPALDPNYSTQYGTGRSGMENVVPVMFFLSLVVNFYLGMLIRKLLTRYRSLLSSVRSQTV